MRQLSAKLKAQNEAAGTYASLHLSAPPSEYETLNIKRELQKCFCPEDKVCANEEMDVAEKIIFFCFLLQGLNHLSVLIGVAVVALVVLMMCAITCIYVRKENSKPLQARSEGATRRILTNEAAPQEYQGDSVYVMMSSAGAAMANQESVIFSSIDFTKPKPREVRSVSSLRAVHSITQDSSTGESYRAREAQAQNEAAGTYASLQLSAPPSEYETLNINRGSNHLSVLIGVAVVALVVLMMCAITCIYVRKENSKLLQARSEGATRSVLTNEAAPQKNQGDSVYVMMSSAGAAMANQVSVIFSSIDFTKPKPREVRSVSSLRAVHSITQDSSTGESTKAREAQVIVSADVLTKQTQLKESEEELLVDSFQLYAQVKRRSP
ncbi:sialic acid-binding Ig-like lectin 7 [Labeo rohita]|uniref:Sialic acid-binding Ig-like lectin 7 n=1 Tax=Labeo rohita TaxID=84645 RepID=A0A498LS44_LABRO|nr:sialic acid-binding Ig-like lectin 7 [Labeo rohita]